MAAILVAATLLAGCASSAGGRRPVRSPAPEVAELRNSASPGASTAELLKADADKAWAEVDALRLELERCRGERARAWTEAAELTAAARDELAACHATARADVTAAEAPQGAPWWVAPVAFVTGAAAGAAAMVVSRGP